MTKEEVIIRMARQTTLSQNQAREAIEALTSIFSDSFVKKENVTLRGFGTMKVILRKGKKARDISRKNSVMVPEHYTVKFIPSAILKKNLWKLSK